MMCLIIPLLILPLPAVIALSKENGIFSLFLMTKEEFSGRYISHCINAFSESWWITAFGIILCMAKMIYDIFQQYRLIPENDEGKLSNTRTAIANCLKQSCWPAPCTLFFMFIFLLPYIFCFTGFREATIYAFATAGVVAESSGFIYSAGVGICSLAATADDFNWCYLLDAFCIGFLVHEILMLPALWNVATF